MKTPEKYSIQKAPQWANSLNEKELLSLCTDNDKINEIKKNGKGVCYADKEIIKVSEEKTERYVLKAWNLSNAEILQLFSVAEILLTDSQRLILHRLDVIRDGKLIKKVDNVDVKILDEEASSRQGFISKLKKAHWSVGDLRLNDVLIFEYSIISEFDEQDFLDKRYFRYVKSFDRNYWFYKNWDFKLIQERAEELLLNKKYFRDEKGQKIESPTLTIKKGEAFNFNEVNLEPNSQNNVFVPYFEFATNTTWPEIASEIYLLYKNSFDEKEIIKSPAYKGLKLTGSTDGDIRIFIEYVQNEIVYLYDAEVMHGHIPQAAHQTLLQKSGDCKAKSLLLVTLLKTIGVESEIVLVHYAQDFFIPESLPSPFIFNHVVVKINHKGKEYFVDSTWSNRFGLLEYRSEPFFSNYLPIKDGAELKQKPTRKSSDFNGEEHVIVKLEEEKGNIQIENLSRLETADVVRNNFRRWTKNQLIESQSKYVAEKTCLLEPKKFSDHFKDVIYEIVSDNEDKNEIKTIYKAKLNDPFTKIKTSKTFRYYNLLNIKPIITWNHLDSPCHSFYSYPVKLTIDIETVDFILKTAIAGRETEIDNTYFKFSSKKSIFAHKVHVVNEFMPKNYGYINNADLERVKEDYRKVNDSNFGIGLSLGDFLKFLISSRYWKFILAGIIILGAILNILSSNN